MIEHLLATLPTTPAGPCLSQRAFYRMRHALQAQVGITRAAILPDTELDAIVPRDGRTDAWDRVRSEFGGSKLPAPLFAI